MADSPQTAAATINIVVAACCPSQVTALFVGGSLGDDSVNFTPGASAGEVITTLNGVFVATCTPTGKLIAYGQAGHDDIQVAGSISLSGATPRGLAT